MSEPGGRPLHPVWALTGLVAFATVALAAGVLARLGPLPGAPVSIPWYLLAPLFYLSELAVIHLRFNRHAHTFSMTEIPILIGLHLADPIHLLVGQSIGALAAFGFHRRQAPLKMAFNAAQFGLQTAMAILVFRGIAAIAPPLGLATSGGALLAVLAALVVANLLVNLAIRLSGGRLTVDEMLDVLTLGSLAALMNGALGLVAVNIIWLRPSGGWLAAVPPAILFLAYRAYVAQRQERGRLAALYEVTRELHGTPQIDGALRAVTARARSLFEADIAEVTLLVEGTADSGFVTGSGPGQAERVMQRVSIADTDPLALRAMRERNEVLDELVGGGRQQTGRAMASPLFEGDTAIGALVVRNPLGDVSTFGAGDLTMLATLAGQVSVSLENGRLEDSLVQLTRLKEELHHQTLHDGLTGLANRRLLQTRLDQAAAEASRRSAALLFLDLDDFKAVNDSLGHHAGDDLLRMVADRLIAACRPGDTVARIGGDEFAILLVGLPRPLEAEVVSERILETLRRPFVLREQTVFVSASLGIAHLGAGDASDDVLRRADQAMYAAKWREKGSYEVFADSLSEGVRRWIELRSEVRPALEDGSIRLHYQPVVRLGDGSVVGAEGLLRWTHPRLGPIEPLELLSVAEEGGMMPELAAWTVARAAEDLAVLRTIQSDLWVSVNLSADQLEPGIVERVAEALARRDLPAEAMTIEITETAATQSAEAVLEKLAALGVRIALDDFGTGYSSLARLDTLPIDLLKVDRSFVVRTSSPEGSPLMKMMLEIAGTLGLATVAEGVETAEHREALLELGYEYAQGFLYAPALSLPELEALLLSRVALPKV